MVQLEALKNKPGVGMSGTLVPMGTGVPAGTNQNLKILGTDGYRVPARKIFWLPTGTGNRQNF